MEPTIYEINSIKYEHLELTWGQDKEILAMVSKISGKVDGKETIGFNAKFLVEMLNVLESEEVKLELAGPTRAGILLPVEEVDHEEILMLVMPVMLSH